MKKLACFALLVLLFANCKNNNSDQESESVKTPSVTTTSAPVKQETNKNNETETEDCKDVEVEMGSGRECIVKSTDLNKVYQNIIKNKEVEETEYYLSDVPNETKSVEVNKNGLMSIDYVITKDKAAISMNYAGGVTEVTLEKVNNTIKKSIYHYAD